MPYPQVQRPATILSGASLSQGLYLGGRLVSIQTPASWTAAVLTFQGSQDGITYADYYDANGTEVSVTAAANQLIAVGPDPSAVFIKVRSGTSGAPVNQAADRVLNLLVERRPIPGGRGDA